jgi:EAL domain-containing protein (putative c-di-GMP-specific phosphodiesterase class I)
MVKAIVDMALGLGLTTVAEGVETAEQVVLLRELGCERAQGYYFAKPLPAAAAGDLLAAAPRSGASPETLGCRSVTPLSERAASP